MAKFVSCLIRAPLGHVGVVKAQLRSRFHNIGTGSHGFGGRRKQIPNVCLNQISCLVVLSKSRLKLTGLAANKNEPRS